MRNLLTTSPAIAGLMYSVAERVYFTIRKDIECYLNALIDMVIVDWDVNVNIPCSGLSTDILNVLCLFILIIV